MHQSEYLLRKVAKLPNRLQVAYAAACAEHVLPLFEHLRGGEVLRKALEVAWRYAFGQDVPFEELRLADEAASAVIPHIDQDPSEEANLSMSAGVNVLETLDSVKDGSPAAAVRAATGALSALSIASQMADPSLVDNFNDVKDLKTPEAILPKVLEEWNVQEEMLSQLGSSKLPTVGQDWKQKHRQRGAETLKWWTTVKGRA